MVSLFKFDSVNNYQRGGGTNQPPSIEQTALTYVLTSVQEEVILEVGLLGESSGTDVTFEGPRAAVDIHVRLEITGSGERLGAEATFVRLFLRSGREI